LIVGAKPIITLDSEISRINGNKLTVLAVAINKFPYKKSPDD